MKIKLQQFGLALLLTAITLSGCEKETPSAVTSKNFTVTSWSWESPYYITRLSVPELTSDNINSAAVMVYFNTIAGNWYAVPWTQYNSPYNYYMGYITSAGTVKVTWVYDSSLSSGNDPNAYYSANVKCKVVVVPEAQRKANPDLDLTDYEAVKATFHLKD